MRFSGFRLVEQAAAVLKKDFLVALRQRAAIAAMAMFSLTATAIVSLAVGGAVVEPRILAAIFWVLIFFAASAGIAGTFEEEAAAGTLATLKIYAEPQAILFGKMAFVLASLVMVSAFLVPIFLILFDVEIARAGIFLATVLLGLVGISGAGTLMAALTVSASVKGGLFSILLFPITVPIFLPAIRLTEAAIMGAAVEPEFLFVMVLYDAILVLAASILYDFLG